MNLLTKVTKSKGADLIQQVCIKDASKLLDKPENSCGYTTARQQETSEEAFEKHNKKNLAR